MISVMLEAVAVGVGGAPTANRRMIPNSVNQKASGTTASRIVCGDQHLILGFLTVSI